MNVIFIVSLLFCNIRNINGNKLEIEEKPCSIYLAESSIPNAGYGMYTTEDIAKDEVVWYDIAIPITDIMYHLGEDGPNIRWTHDDYVWKGDFANEFLLAKKVSINSFPIGALTNFHTYLNNVRPSDYGYNDSLLSDEDVGKGAFSYNFRIFSARRNIRSGEELFSNYGESWLDSHNLNDVPRKKNFQRAQRIIHEILQDDIVEKKHLEVLSTIISFYDKRTAALLPYSDLDVILNEDVGVENYTAFKTITKRSIEWIKENGQCMDNMYGDLSSIDQAGKGAFAKRFIPAGSVIDVQPLLHIMNKKNLTIFETEQNLKHQTGEQKDISKQLLLNYCFGHEHSSMILCQSTYSALINHDSMNANVDYRWSLFSNSVPEWLKMSLEDISNRKDKGLSFDIVATKDIKPGEEIFMDYGISWQNAWEEHVRNFKPSFHNSASVHKMNDDMHPIYVNNTYAPNIMTICSYYQNGLGRDFKGEYLEGHDYDHNDFLKLDKELQLQLIHNFSVPFSSLDIDEETEKWPCKVISMEDELIYTVRIFQSPVFEITKWNEEKSYKFVTDLPRTNIEFAVRPYKAHMFDVGVFRHEISIKDDIFPDHWKNLI